MRLLPGPRGPAQQPGTLPWDLGCSYPAPLSSPQCVPSSLEQPGLAPPLAELFLLYIRRVREDREELARPGLGPWGLTHTVQPGDPSFNDGSIAT